MILSVSWVEFRTPSLVLVAIAATALLSLMTQKLFGRDMTAYPTWAFVGPDEDAEAEHFYAPIAQNLVDVSSPNQLAFVSVPSHEQAAQFGPPQSQARDEFFADDHREAYLLLKEVSDLTAARVPLTGSVVVGRRDPQGGPVDIDLSVVPGSEYVSRHHARIEHTDEGWQIIDINSANGVYVREVGAPTFSTRLESPRRLANGDDIAFAGVIATFHETSPASHYPAR